MNECRGRELSEVISARELGYVWGSLKNWVWRGSRFMNLATILSHAGCPNT